MLSRILNIQNKDCKNFTNECFRRDLLLELLPFQNVQPNEFGKFKFIVSKPLNSHAKLKEKHIRCNQAVFMNKELHKAIMTRTCLFNAIGHQASFRRLYEVRPSYRRLLNVERTSDAHWE